MIRSMEEFKAELGNNKLVQMEKFELMRIPAAGSLISIQRELQRIEPTVLDFYELVNGLEVIWKPANKEKLNEEMTGSIKIHSFSETVKDWSGTVFFDNEPGDSALRKFFPLDFFADEAAAGFCTMEGWRNMIYLYRFDGELQPLQINFESYLRLMLVAKGCFYWQYLLIALLEKNENEVSSRIKNHLPDIFPEFSFNEFESLFNNLRIN